MHKLIDFDWLITSGGITQKDINKRRDLGWNFVTSVPAKLIHPWAMESDTATIFSKYTPYPKNGDESVSHTLGELIKKAEDDKNHKEFWDALDDNKGKDVEVE